MANKFPNLFNIVSLTLLLSSSLCVAQTKTFTVVDSLTKVPIDLVHISYPSLEVGSISNADGRITLPLKQEKIAVSHINYLPKAFSYQQYVGKDTIYLIAKSTELDEVVVYNIDLKQKLASIIDQSLLKYYAANKIIHNSTYKETFRINDSLSRLFQIQLRWWSKNGLFDFKSQIDNQNKLAIDNVDYSKIKKYDSNTPTPDGVFSKNEDFFRFAHLNFLVVLLRNFSEDIVIQSVKKDENSIEMVFDATLRQNGKEVYTFKNSRIIFNNTYSIISYIQLHMVYDAVFEKDFSETKNIAYEKAVTNHTIELSFEKNNKDKYMVNYFVSELKGIIKFSDGIENKIAAKQSLFVSESAYGKNIRNKDLVELKEPFFESIPATKQKVDAKMLLTKEEEAFLKQQL